MITVLDQMRTEYTAHGDFLSRAAKIFDLSTASSSGVFPLTDIIALVTDSKSAEENELIGVLWLERVLTVETLMYSLCVAKYNDAEKKYGVYHYDTVAKWT